LARPAPDFGRLAATYDEVRPQDRNWWELFELVVREGDLRGRRVLDVGCGTGRFAAALAAEARVWGVDPSPEMLEQARRNVPASVGLKRGCAEALPFKERWFERAAMILVAHLVERPTAFAEIHRVLVPGGRLVLSSFDPASLGGYYLTAFFPSIEAANRERFPTAETLSLELRRAGFTRPRLARFSGSATIERTAAIRRIRDRHLWSFDVVGDDEYAQGLERAERELPATVEYGIELLIVSAERG